MGSEKASAWGRWATAFPVFSSRENEPEGVEGRAVGVRWGHSRVGEKGRLFPASPWTDPAATDPKGSLLQVRCQPLL